MARAIVRVAMDFVFVVPPDYHGRDRSYVAVANWKHRKRCRHCRRLNRQPDGGQRDPVVQHHFSRYRRPPLGPGWQWWQTTTGSPLTPVFGTEAELLDYVHRTWKGVS